MLLEKNVRSLNIIGSGKLKLTVATTTSCNNSPGLAGCTLFGISSNVDYKSLTSSHKTKSL